MKRAKLILFCIALFVLLAFASHFDRWVWELAHPSAPSWTYWFTR